MDTAATGISCLQVQIPLLSPYHDKHRLLRCVMCLIRFQVLQNILSDRKFCFLAKSSYPFLSVSSPDKVVRSIQVIALSNQAAWFAFFIERLPVSVLHLLSIAEVFARHDSAQSRSSLVPGFLFRV